MFLSQEMLVVKAFNKLFLKSSKELLLLYHLREEGNILIKEKFLDESNVTFDTLVTASGDNLLVVRETGGQFLDFYTVCLGYEIELTLFPAEGKPLTEDQVNKCLEFIKTLDIVPIRG